MKLFLLVALLRSGAVVQAQLLVSVSPPKTTGSKALVKLEMVNGFSETVESARADCFVLDEQGKMIGQTTQWVIGGTREHPALEPGKANVFHFVIPTENLSTTNLAAKINFSRVILEGGRLADVNAGVKVENAPQIPLDSHFLNIEPPIHTEIQVQPLGVPGQMPTVPLNQVRIVP